MSTPFFWMIVGMGIVTYIPRLLPLIMLQTENWPKWSKRMLSRVPYAVLGALIFPGILTVNENFYYGIIGGLIAIALAYLKMPLIIVVAGAISSLAFISYIF
ncbi:AzlD domain-containing protein [Evansella cellulosilytica]|uniref:Branched-chain amino acid transport n=1 Tax=Evansella cellulosilytica (strain ATCC 21833 / DSM 2522 / FERM P-1141 / JCM 9156 / N-4) TaxID=649639 RepID=E6TXY7_EVAC2|nr:AzlD domain-containing protein [Evansella cellulosilytica]ADU31200.1 branched-chain amino acid transport [Evansella cellulosilytica DSM 2522]